MTRILDIAFKDLLQLRRDFKTFMFLLLMPILFTLLFGYAFGAFSGESDARLPVGYLDQDNSWVSHSLHDQLVKSDVIQLDEDDSRSYIDLEQLVTDEKLAATIIVPDRYGKTFLHGRDARLIVIADTGTTIWTTIEADIIATISRLDSALRTATILEGIDAQRMPFDYSFEQSLTAWDDPPIAVVETTSSVIQRTDNQAMSLAQTSPAMMLQFAIAGLLTAAQVIVTERKSRTLQRLLTTAANRLHILLGHYLAIFILIFTQFTLLLTFSQFILHVEYLRLPAATLLVAFCAALCIAAMGLLIGILARSEEQAVIFSLIPMFVLSGLGGAWVPLEVTGETFRAIGHVSPVAWALDGFKNISVRGFGFGSVLLPAAALTGYAIMFFALAVWRLNVSEER
jgi:ABC-2 type transport system permease protein